MGGRVRDALGRAFPPARRRAARAYLVAVAADGAVTLLLFGLAVAVVLAAVLALGTLVRVAGPLLGAALGWNLMFALALLVPVVGTRLAAGLYARVGR